MSSTRNEFIQLVTELHYSVGYTHPTEPCLISDMRSHFWLNLLKEEIMELEAAVSRSDLIAIADALGDCLYVTVGASIAFGIPIEDVFREIHRSNMTKDVILQAEGIDGSSEVKLQKGARYTPPICHSCWDQMDSDC